jgi:hypothetical protein
MLAHLCAGGRSKEAKGFQALQEIWRLILKSPRSQQGVASADFLL